MEAKICEVVGGSWKLLLHNLHSPSLLLARPPHPTHNLKVSGSNPLAAIKAKINDGAIYSTLPLLIEAGVDIINPWQVNCVGMDDTAKLKREYGKDLTIWGGSCDTQRVLPFGTPQEVREETRRRIADLAPGGGLIFAPIHVIQSGVPVENIIAWWETWQEYGAY